MERKIVYICLLLLLLADTGYSFLQHYNMPLDGDMRTCLVPQDNIKPVLNDPLGWKVLTEKKSYPNPNRFFSHWLYYKYFNNVPLFLQKFTTPIDSVYLSCAIAKIFIQLGLIFLLATAITGSTNLLKTDFILAAVLITPFFQTNGYKGQMAIIDPTITYTFFYALPCFLLLLYFLPFIRRNYHNKAPKVQTFIRIFWIPFAFVICLSGPLNPGIVVVLACLVLIWAIRKSYLSTSNQQWWNRSRHILRVIPQNGWFYLIPVGLLSVYSLYIGSYNTLSSVSPRSLSELYLILPKGVFQQLTLKPGLLLLITALILNVILVHRHHSDESKKILWAFKWIGLFALLYILLLPFGGFRWYRAMILRYDTIMPVTLCLLFLFGLSTLFLIKNISRKQRLWYLPIIIGTLFIFTQVDQAEFDQNDCERTALQKIADSTEEIVKLTTDCNVVSWDQYSAPEDSELNAQLLKTWRITDKRKLYYHKVSR